MVIKCARTVLLAFAVAITAFASYAETLGLKAGASRCAVDLDGARITSLIIGGREILWNDSPLQRTARDWAHGGIPLCWPNFGVDSLGKIHGSAWRKPFRLLFRKDEPLRGELVVALAEGDLRLEYKIILTDALTLEMTTINCGEKIAKCSYGFHPYFLVGERDCCLVNGVDGFAFEDDPSVLNPAKGVWKGNVGLTAAIDRIFALPSGGKGFFRLHDKSKNCAVLVGCEGASHVNIWNPGVEKRCPGLIPSDQWRHFVCVEPIVDGDTQFGAISPGSRRTLKMTIQVEK